jgi:hypothetical protein
MYWDHVRIKYSVWASQVSFSVPIFLLIKLKYKSFNDHNIENNTIDDTMFMQSRTFMITIDVPHWNQGSRYGKM